jgi:hypothetical protein
MKTILLMLIISHITSFISGALIVVIIKKYFEK